VKKFSSNLDNTNCLLTNLSTENRKGLLATRTENKIQPQKIHDTKPDRRNKWNYTQAGCHAY